MLLKSLKEIIPEYTVLICSCIANGRFIGILDEELFDTYKTAKLLLLVVIYTIATMKRYGYSQQNDFNVIYAKIVVGQIVGKIQNIQKIYEKIQLNKRIYLCNN